LFLLNSGMKNYLSSTGLRKVVFVFFFAVVVVPGLIWIGYFFGGRGGASVTVADGADRVDQAAVERRKKLSAFVESYGKDVDDYYKSAARLESAMGGSLLRLRELKNDFEGDSNSLDALLKSSGVDDLVQIDVNVFEYLQGVNVALILREAILKSDYAYYSEIGDIESDGWIGDRGRGFAVITQCEFGRALVVDTVVADGGKVRRIPCLNSMPVLIAQLQKAREKSHVRWMALRAEVGK
jgi:hypothetical protein